MNGAGSGHQHSHPALLLGKSGRDEELGATTADLFPPLGTRGKHHVRLEQGACAEIPLQMCLLRACSWRRTKYVCVCVTGRKAA